MFTHYIKLTNERPSHHTLRGQRSSRVYQQLFARNPPIFRLFNTDHPAADDPDFYCWRSSDYSN